MPARWDVDVTSAMLGSYHGRNIAEADVPRELTKILQSLEHVLGAGISFELRVRCEVSEASPSPAGGEPPS